jgi:hypothetical protein
MVVRCYCSFNFSIFICFLVFNTIHGIVIKIITFTVSSSNDCFFIFSICQVPWNLPYHAYLTIPPEVVLAPSSIRGAGLGILSQTFISKYTWLAEYEGTVVGEDKVDSSYRFTVVVANNCC